MVLTFEVDASYTRYFDALYITERKAIFGTLGSKPSSDAPASAPAGQFDELVFDPLRVAALETGVHLPDDPFAVDDVR